MSTAPTLPASLLHSARADVVRQVRCTLAALAQAPAVLDLTRCGVLLETAALLRVGSQHICELIVDGQSVFLPARVAHTRYYKPDNGPAMFQVGLAFRLLSPPHWVSLNRLTDLLGLRTLTA